MRKVVLACVLAFFGFAFADPQDVTEPGLDRMVLSSSVHA